GLWHGCLFEGEGRPALLAYRRRQGCPARSAHYPGNIYCSPIGGTGDMGMVGRLVLVAHFLRNDRRSDHLCFDASNAYPSPMVIDGITPFLNNSLGSGLTAAPRILLTTRRSIVESPANQFDEIINYLSPPLSPHSLLEIGRASCRERV